MQGSICATLPVVALAAAAHVCCCVSSSCCWSCRLVAGARHKLQSISAAKTCPLVADRPDVSGAAWHAILAIVSACLVTAAAAVCCCWLACCRLCSAAAVCCCCSCSCCAMHLIAGGRLRPTWMPSGGGASLMCLALHAIQVIAPPCLVACSCCFCCAVQLIAGAGCVCTLSATGLMFTSDCSRLRPA